MVLAHAHHEHEVGHGWPIVDAATLRRWPTSSA
jgi:hypothetical protein